MCCKNLGIGLIVLSITLFLGITIGEFFKIKNIPDIKVIGENDFIEVIEENDFIEITENRKNCVPKDENLKYQNLPFDKSEKNKYQNLPYSDKQRNPEINRLIELYEQHKKLKEELEKADKSDTKKVKEIQRALKFVGREMFKSPKQPKQLEKDKFDSQYQHLIHSEKCSDSK